MVQAHLKRMDHMWKKGCYRGSHWSNCCRDLGETPLWTGPLSPTLTAEELQDLDPQTRTGSAWIPRGTSEWLQQVCSSRSQWLYSTGLYKAKIFIKTNSTRYKDCWIKMMNVLTLIQYLLSGYMTQASLPECFSKRRVLQVFKLFLTDLHIGYLSSHISKEASNCTQIPSARMQSL